MWITSKGKNSTEIEENVVRRVLNLYPEEELENRPVFLKAFRLGRISLDELKSESEKVLIPWQMFLLSEHNLNRQLQHIDEQRLYKVSSKLVAKRRGAGEVTSKRIIDRLIRQQNFITSQQSLPLNQFCGSLKHLHTKVAAEKILAHFGIDRQRLWQYTTKGKALEYLVNRVESQSINISRGVLTHKLLPNWQVVSTGIYKNTSGFVIRDDHVPFIFLPSETNPDEVESRQIYSLMYLLAIIGLEQYEYFLDTDFKAKMLKARGVKKRFHEIASEVLIPSEETEKYRGAQMTPSLRDSLASMFKVSPSALVTTLGIRGIISNTDLETLKPEPYVPSGKKPQRRSPNITTSVKKFCGQVSYEAINNAIRSGQLKSIQAQYLIFGAVNKKGYRNYRKELGI